MFRITGIYLLMCAISLRGLDENVLTVQMGSADQTQQTALTLCFGEDSKDSAYAVAQFLNSTGFFTVTLQQGIADVAQTLAQALQDDVAAVLFVQAGHHNQARGIEWRLYEPLGNSMLAGKKVVATTVNDIARHCAADVYETLLGQQPSFFSYIAVCKKVPCRGRKMASHMVLVDPFTGQAETMVTGNRLLAAPSWMVFNDKPCLIYSELTPSNVRFVGADFDGKRWPILDVDGTCAGSVQDPTTGDIFYCRSGSLWRYRFNAAASQGVHQRIMANRKVSSCPSIGADGSLVFSYGTLLKRYDLNTQAVHDIVLSGPATAPAASAADDAIVFSRRARGGMQLFLTDSTGKKTTQLTHDDGDKIDPTFSPCGNFIAFIRVRDRAEQLCFYNRVTGGYRVITEPRDHYSYPCWSPATKSLYSRQNR